MTAAGAPFKAPAFARRRARVLLTSGGGSAHTSLPGGTMGRILRTAFLLLPVAAWAAQGQPVSGLDTAKIEALTGLKGTAFAEERVFKVSAPRSDVAVTVDGLKMKPPMGLTSWAAFKKAPGGAIVMGDLTMLEDEVNPVMSACLDGGLEVTALHNHFF